jgi:uncharacterized heparinase superfamily protein
LPGNFIRMTSLAVRALRAAAFLRHVPPERIVRRVWLEARRQALAGRANSRAPLPSTSGSLDSRGFEPLFDQQGRDVEVHSDGFVFSFLGRSLATGRKIDWTAKTGPAADQLWRMNLHYMEYLRGVGDDVFAEMVEQWITGNRPYGKGYWRDAWNAYALSIRTTVWMEEFARRHARLAPGFVARLRDSLAEQLAFLTANLETDIGGNHLIKNIRALATGARVFADPHSAAMRRRAEKLLSRALDEQILSDGMHFERSPSYHNQVLGDLLAIHHALGRDAGPDVASRIVSVLAAMAHASVDLTHPDGHVGAFNDSGLNMGPDLRALAAAYRCVFGEPPSPRRHFAFREAGYFGFRDAALYLVADCGRLGPDALMAHAHGDALSFELSVAGERIVVDQGVYEYVAGARREAARAARSHNTLAVAGLDQADFFGAFRCGARPDVHVTEYRELPSGFRLEGEHNGFTRTGKGPVHRRCFELESGQLKICDRLEGPVPGMVTTSLLLHPACRVVEDNGGAAISRGSARVRVTATVPFALTSAVYWPDMGIEEGTVRIIFHWPTGVSDAAIRIAVDAGARYGTGCMK